MNYFYIFVGIIFAAAVLLLKSSKKPKETKPKETKPKACNSCNSPPGVNLLPITDPAFNLREVAKQMLLLEDHLTNKGKLCEQCIKKHSLTIEAYLEEALCLDSHKKYCDEINRILDQFRGIEKDITRGLDPQMVAQKLRELRKDLHVKYFAVGLI